jgi:type III secretion protein N (ATPase)
MAVAAGESAGRAGFPASVFSELARFTECAGATRSGSVTLVATVLNDGDERDPVSEAARALLDGHIELSPRLAHAGQFPAIDVLASASRTMNDVVAAAHARDAAAVRGALAALSSCADARAVGLHPADPAALRALHAEDALERFLRQGCERSEPGATLANLRMLADSVKEDRWTLPPTSPP